MVRISFLHPDLGIGGAERLVVDMALALSSRGHTVTLYTAHHDPSHCFPETTDGSLRVVARFDWLPRTLFGRCAALCAALRMVLLALFVRLTVTSDLYIVDQVSLCVPFLRLFSTVRVLFYCHYPDLLLTDRRTTLKRLYRAPLDWLEGWSTRSADKVLVNSEFTREVVRETFGGAAGYEVLYPSLNTASFDESLTEEGGPELYPPQRSSLFLSLNRYERKKDVILALRALRAVRAQCGEEAWEGVQLVVAGGWDARVRENVEHHAELVEEALDLGGHVTFLRSIDTLTKLRLLHSATALLYTPSREHFGIVPVEAMYCGTPVVAVNSGGPRESVADGVTGWLVEPTGEGFAEAMMRFMGDDKLSETMGQKGRERVKELFSFESFTEKLNAYVMELV